MALGSLAYTTGGKLAHSVPTGNLVYKDKTSYVLPVISAWGRYGIFVGPNAFPDVPTLDRAAMYSHCQAMFASEPWRDEGYIIDEWKALDWQSVPVGSASWAAYNVESFIGVKRANMRIHAGAKCVDLTPYAGRMLESVTVGFWDVRSYDGIPLVSEVALSMYNDPSAASVVASAEHYDSSTIEFAVGVRVDATYPYLIVFTSVKNNEPPYTPNAFPDFVRNTSTITNIMITVRGA